MMGWDPCLHGMTWSLGPTGPTRHQRPLGWTWYLGLQEPGQSWEEPAVLFHRSQPESWGHGGWRIDWVFRGQSGGSLDLWELASKMGQLG